MGNETDRSDYVAGLRALADTLEQHSDVPLPTSDVTWAVHRFGGEREQKAIMATIARALPCTLAKNDPADSEYNARYFTLTGRIGALPVEVWADRANVCRRVVTGTREVTKTVPAPGAPMVEVTETVEDVEWVCEPLLAEATS